MNDSLHVVCPHCAAVNRISAAKLSESPVCGQCKQRLFIGEPLELTASNFDRHIGRNDLPVVVDFWASWCSPCQMMAPEFAKAANQASGEAIFVKVNTDEQQQIAAQFRIHGIPAFALIKHGKIAAQTSGFQPASRLLEWMRQA